MPVAPGSFAPVASVLGRIIFGASEGPNWIGSLFGGFVALIFLIFLVASIAFAPVDLCRRTDIGLGKKLLWLAAFVLSGGLVLIVYGLVRFSRTNGSPGE